MTRIIQKTQKQQKPSSRWGLSSSKRAFDLLVALTGLIAVMPLLLIVGVVVRFKMGSPILFCQVRPGLHQKPFTLYKFRTMLDKCDSSGSLLADEQRLTQFGRFLRSTSIDELPELWNVIRGEISLVGPRPLMMEYLDLYTPEQNRRHDIRPGITGWQQISGRNLTDWKTRFIQDVWYVDNCTFWLGTKILLTTVVKVISGNGVEAENSVTPERFKGTNLS